MAFQTENEAREQWAAMKNLPEDFKEFSEEVMSKDPSVREAHLLGVFNVSTSRRPSWWAGFFKEVSEGLAEAASSGNNTFSVNLIRRGLVVTSFKYDNPEQALDWATTVYKQNTGVNTDKFRNAQLDTAADFWSISAVHKPSGVTVQVSMNLEQVTI